MYDRSILKSTYRSCWALMKCKAWLFPLILLHLAFFRYFFPRSHFGLMNRAVLQQMMNLLKMMQMLNSSWYEKTFYPTLKLGSSRRDEAFREFLGCWWQWLLEQHQYYLTSWGLQHAIYALWIEIWWSLNLWMYIHSFSSNLIVQPMRFLIPSTERFMMNFLRTKNER